MTQPQGITLRDIQASQACMVPDCPNKTSPNTPFCRYCYAAMPKRSRRKFWKLWQEHRLWNGYTAEYGVIFWRLVSARLAKQNRRLLDFTKYWKEWMSRYNEVEQLHGMGLNLRKVHELGVENHRLREAVELLIKGDPVNWQHIKVISKVGFDPVTLHKALVQIATIKDRIPFDAADAATECIRIAKEALK